jgi:hypothetical protein
MWPFIVAGIIVVLTVLLGLLTYDAYKMSDAPATANQLYPALLKVFAIGLGLAAMVASMHWW